MNRWDMGVGSGGRQKEDAKRQRYKSFITRVETIRLSDIHLPYYHLNFNNQTTRRVQVEKARSKETSKTGLLNMNKSAGLSSNQSNAQNKTFIFSSGLLSFTAKYLHFVNKFIHQALETCKI